ncbi:WW domain-containing protein [Phytophthora infestans]|uniref:WW domain-containing protein n=1 Tax=Phytophthora infestans TaxID=4787 RepID=A0A8S9V1U0_PHYIN|nr:WW domain-containing protein [Phytophthora infestans]
MTESTTRDFISQWTYDGYDNVRWEPTTQWRGVDRVAKQIRQREECRLEEDFTTMDFNSRAAALEAHYFQTPRLASGRKSPVGVRPVTRARPQSASFTRRVAENNRPTTSRARPQSATTRSEVSCSTNAVQTENRVAWKAATRQNFTKWREMLARGPKFEQLSLRRLELETYELLYNTLHQHQDVDTKARTRSRRRKNSVTSAAKPQDCSPTLACGSGLHLARSRKRRQQEHDRRLMLGKNRESSRVDSVDNRRAIQDKTRARSKQVSKKRFQKQRPENQQARQVFTPETQQRSSYVLHQTRTAKGPWIPSGLSSSRANRAKSFEASEMLLSKEKRVAQVLAAFQSQADTHLRLSRKVQTQLKAQQSATERRPRTDRGLENFTAAKTHANSTRPKSAKATVSRQISNRPISSDQQLNQRRSNQETDESAAVGKKSLRSTRCALQSPEYAWSSESPATLTLVIPPLKLPPHMWGERESFDDPTDKPSVQSLELGAAYGDDPESVAESRTCSYAAIVAEPSTDNEMKHEDVDCDLAAVTSTEVNDGKKLDIETNELEASCICQDSDVNPIETTIKEFSDQGQNGDNVSTRQQSSVIVEEEYLAESLLEQAAESLSGDTEPSPTALVYEEPQTTVYFGISFDDGNSQPCSGKDDESNSNMLHDETKLCGEDDAQSNEGQVRVKDSASSPQEITELATSFAVNYSALDLNSADVDTPGASFESNVDCGEDLMSVNKVDPSTRLEVIGLGETARSVDISDGVVETNFQTTSGVSVLQNFGESEYGLSGRTSDESATIVDEVNTSLSAIDTQQSEQNVYGDKSSMSAEVILSDQVEETSMAAPSSDLVVEYEEINSVQEGCDSLGVIMSGSQHDQSTSGYSEELLRVEAGSLLLDQLHSMESGETLQLLTYPSVMIQASDLATNETTDRLDPSDRGADAQFLDNSSHYVESGKRDDEREVELENAGASSNLLILDIETLIKPATITTAPSESDHGTHEIEQQAQSATVKSISVGAKSEPRSPKKKRSCESETTCSDKCPTPDDSVTLHLVANTLETSTFLSLPMQEYSPKSPDCTGLPGKEPLRLDQQVTRTIVEQNSDGIIHPQPSQEQVECDDELNATVVVATVSEVVDGAQLEQIENPVEERENIDGDAVSPLERGCFQPSNDRGSTLEKYSHVIEVATLDLGTTPYNEKAIVFSSDASGVDNDSTLKSAMTDTCSQAKPEQVDPPELFDQASRQDEVNVPSNSARDADEVSLLRNSHAQEHHNAARKIQSQYRCFVRRQLIRDQLRFVVAKKRRQTRRKTRQKVKKSDAVDMAASVASTNETESPVTAVAVNADLVDNVEVEEVQNVALSTVVSVEMTPIHAPLLSEPQTQVVGVGARKGSSEYVFDLFDDSQEENGDMQEATLQEDYEKDEFDTTSSELPQGEEPVSLQQPTLLPSETIDVGQSSDKPAATPGHVEAASEVEAMQPRWDRYVDSTTSKSFYYNPVTNETQWTAPVEDRDHSAINSSDVAAATATDAVVSPSGQATPSQGTWQGYLDEASGQLYYYNTKTGECSWEPPSSDSSGVAVSLQSAVTAESAAIGVSSWVMYIDPASQAPYYRYVNVETLATSWEQPDSFTVAAVAEPNGTATANEDSSYVIDDHAALEI